MISAEAQFAQHAQRQAGGGAGRHARGLGHAHPLRHLGERAVALLHDQHRTPSEAVPPVHRHALAAARVKGIVNRHHLPVVSGSMSLDRPARGKTHLAIALGVEAVNAGRSVYFTTLADLVGSLAKAEREGALRERIRFLCRPQLLIVDEIGYLPVIAGGGNLFFQLVNARYERGAMILTSNRGFAEWGEVFGGPVVASALLDRLLHHAIVVRIEGASYRLRRHADLLPETATARQMSQPDPVPRRRGRPPKARPAALNTAS